MMMEEKERHNAELMTRRIRRILLVCNNYDSYSLEEDGHIEAQIAEDYSALNLSNPPEIRFLMPDETTRARYAYRIAGVVLS